MGCNYYLEGYKPRKLSSEPKEQKLHIGKSSYGWVFALHVLPEQGINDLPDWLKLFHEEDTRIVDEYGREVSREEMVDIIVNREYMEPKKLLKDQEFLDVNQAEYGEFVATETLLGGLTYHLLRSRISEETCCVGHGDGTWDLITGEFS